MLIEYLRTPRTRYHGGLRLKQPIAFAGRVTDGRVVFTRVNAGWWCGEWKEADGPK